MFSDPDLAEAIDGCGMTVGSIQVVAAEGVAFITSATTSAGQLLPGAPWRPPAWTSAMEVEEHTWPWILLDQAVLDRFLERQLDAEALAESVVGDAEWSMTSDVVVAVIQGYPLAYTVEISGTGQVQQTLVGSTDAPLPFRSSAVLNRAAGLTWILGAGAIGSHAAAMLPNWGFTTLAVVDRDIVTSGNVILHMCGPEAIGRSKAKAVADAVSGRFSTVTARGLKADIKGAAAELRGLIPDAPLMLVAVDDPIVRQLCNHLAVSAGVPAVFVAMFHRGLIAEVIAYAPGGPCLNCVRLAVPMDPPQSDTDSPSSYRAGLRSDVQIVAGFASRTAAALIHGPSEDLPELPGAVAYLSGTTITGFASPWRFDVPSQVNWIELDADPSCRVCRGGTPIDKDAALAEVRQKFGLKDD